MHADADADADVVPASSRIEVERMNITYDDSREAYRGYEVYGAVVRVGQGCRTVVTGEGGRNRLPIPLLLLPLPFLLLPIPLLLLPLPFLLLLLLLPPLPFRLLLLLLLLLLP